ncbi:XRE family transcriptional regulator [Salipaludibacillus keqinensis]|uniref:XRE family transcriptional regulator n=1 Tax=Salipaludibacillus keqinensis TaxID=2045207 RepID=A0A323TC81_9BACI|nr:helix-turn-helix domain-containing protein [Salipaludibacillus keqinensis]PYZ92721.1 XRE family transcriptional regulator [Salipaludibacillus keqinensis]
MKHWLIGENIKMLREQAHMSQAELAEGICTQAQISRIEKGEVIPLSSTLYEISRKLEIDMDEFFNMAHDQRFDYIVTVKTEIRKAIRNKDYQSVYDMVKCEQKNAIFSSREHQQFLIWHEGIASYYLNQGFQHSIDLLMKALHMNQGDTSKARYSCTEIEIMNSIGIVYNEEGEFKLSVQYYELALEEMHKIQKNMDLTKIRVYYGLSKSLSRLNNHRQSLVFARKGIDLCIKIETLYLLGDLHFQAGMNCFYLRHFKRSKVHLNKSLLIFEVMENREYVEIISGNIRELFPE